MEAIKKKLNSRRGASILLALLFMLVCIMAGASILTAAASNVGKTRSNREEQQKNLVLSSALTLLRNELENVTYTGKYKYWTEVTNPTGFDPGTSDPATVTEAKHHYEQTDGTLESTSSWLKGSVLPLLNKDMDVVFANNFEVSDAVKNIKRAVRSADEFEATPLPGLPAIPPSGASPYTLEIKANATGGADVYGDLLSTVRIYVKVKADGNIALKAVLLDASGGETAYIMEALLSPESGLALRSHDDHYANDSSGAEEHDAGTVKWTLKYMTRTGGNVFW